MSRTVRTIRKIIVAAVGLPLLGLGIILIPLPGPGVLVSLVALFILSLEFDQAQTHLEKAKNIIRKIYEQSKDRADRISNKFD